jgi:hypothetical protein
MPTKKTSVTEAKAEPRAASRGVPESDPSAGRSKQYLGNAFVMALTEATECVQRVGDLLGHACVARGVLERLGEVRALVGQAEAQSLRDAWEAAAVRARDAFEASTGALRQTERARSDRARQEVLRAFDALGALTAGYVERG